MDTKPQRSMSRLFRPSTKTVPTSTSGDDPNSAFSSLLDDADGLDALSPAHSQTGSASTSYHQSHQHSQHQPHPRPPPHRRTKSSPAFLSSTTTHSELSSRPWLSLLVSDPWAEKPPQRKLIKEPGGGSARPSFSIELGGREERRDVDGERKGAVKRGVERIRELYRRERSGR